MYIRCTNHLQTPRHWVRGEVLRSQYVYWIDRVPFMQRLMELLPLRRSVWTERADLRAALPQSRTNSQGCTERPTRKTSELSVRDISLQQYDLKVVWLFILQNNISHEKLKLSEWKSGISSAAAETEKKPRAWLRLQEDSWVKHAGYKSTHWLVEYQGTLVLPSSVQKSTKPDSDVRK